MEPNDAAAAHGHRRLQVVLVIQSLGGGGAERVTVNLAGALAEAGHRVAIVTLAAAGADAYPLHPAVARLDIGRAGMRTDGRARAGLAANLARVRGLRRTLRRLRPDVAIAMMTTSNVLLGLASVGLGFVTIGSERTHPPQYPLSRVWELGRRFAYRLLDAVVALTTETAEWIRGNTRARRTEVIPNQIVWPIPATPTGPSPGADCPAGRDVVLAVGRLEREKGFDLLIEAFARIAAQRPGWDLVLLGEGSLRPTLLEQAERAGIAGRIRLPGRSGDVGAWYRRAGLYVLSSRFEGFPNTLVEAMASGAPVVSFACPTGPSDIVRDGIDGLLVAPQDVEALAAALHRLTGDPALRARLGAAAAGVRERLAPSAVMPRWLALLDELVAARRGWGHG